MRQPESPSASSFWPLLAAVSLAGNIVANVFAWLREAPLFWRNAGGYPVWMRDTVALAFYPLLLWNVAALGLLAAILIRSPLPGARVLGRRMAWLALLGLLTAMTALVVIANNVENLLNDRPVHWHEPR